MTEENNEFQEENNPAQEEITASPESEEVGNDEESTTSEEDNGEDSAAGRKKGVQKRIDELTRQRYEAQRQAEYWQRMAMQGQQQQPQQQPEAPKVEQPPQLDQYEDYDDYVKALARYEVRQEQKQAQEAQKQQQAQLTKQQAAAQFQQRADEFRTKTPDFDVIAGNPTLHISESMTDAIMESEHGPEILYELGKNQSEAMRIAKLSPVASAREIGKLEARLSLPRAKTTTQAPDPVQPIGKGTGSAVKSEDDMSIDEWMAWRNKQLRG